MKKLIYSSLSFMALLNVMVNPVSAQTFGISSNGSSSSSGNVLHTGTMAVGVGTMAPYSKFQISDYLTFGGTGSEIYFNAYRNGPTTYAMVNGQSGFLSLAGELQYSNAINGVGGSAIGLTTRFVVKTDGKFGIGTTTPGTRLEVKDQAPSNTTDKNVILKLSNAYSGFSGALNEPTLTFDNGTSSGTYGGYGWTVGAQVAGAGYFRIGKFSGSPTVQKEYLRIKDDGKVIIGDPTTFLTNSPYNLFVPVGIRTELVQVDMKNIWPDFVFDKNYKLSSLNEVEKYIATNSHLPGIPSAEEVKKDGINLADMDAKLLQKIEELTLYMIALKKDNDNLKKEVDLLKVSK